jgi:hypothetical protein
VSVALGDPLEVVAEVQRPGQVDLGRTDGGALPVEESDHNASEEHGVGQPGVTPNDPARGFFCRPAGAEPVKGSLDDREAPLPADPFVVGALMGDVALQRGAARLVQLERRQVDLI